MPAKKGRGSPVTPKEKSQYDRLRAAGWSPEEAAEAIGRSKSWGYLYEASKRPDSRKQREERPNDNLSEAVDLICAIKIDEDDQEPAFEIVDRFGMAIMPFLANVAWFLAAERAIELNGWLRGMFAGEPLEQKLVEQPIGPEEILQVIPEHMDRHFAGDDISVEWMPPRAEDLLRRYRENHPELQEIEDELRAELEELKEELGPDEALRELQRRRWKEQGAAEAQEGNGLHPEPVKSD